MEAASYLYGSLKSVLRDRKKRHEARFTSFYIEKPSVLYLPVEKDLQRLISLQGSISQRQHRA